MPGVRSPRRSPPRWLMTTRTVVTGLLAATYILIAFGGLLMWALPMIGITLLATGVVAALGVLAWT